MLIYLSLTVCRKDKSAISQLIKLGNWIAIYPPPLGGRPASVLMESPFPRTLTLSETTNAVTCTDDSSEKVEIIKFGCVLKWRQCEFVSCTYKVKSFTSLCIEERGFVIHHMFRHINILRKYDLKIAYNRIWNVLS